MKHEFIEPHAKWTGDIPDSPSNWAKRALIDTKAATNSAASLEQTLTECEQPLEEIKAIVAIMRDAGARLAGLAVELNLSEADRAWEAREAVKEEKRKQIATANAAREFAEQQAQHNPWRNK